jgi:hypothetical protein
LDVKDSGTDDVSAAECFGPDLRRLSASAPVPSFKLIDPFSERFSFRFTSIQLILNSIAFMKSFARNVSAAAVKEKKGWKKIYAISLRMKKLLGIF